MNTCSEWIYLEIKWKIPLFVIADVVNFFLTRDKITEVFFFIGLKAIDCSVSYVILQCGSVFFLMCYELFASFDIRNRLMLAQISWIHRNIQGLIVKYFVKNNYDS